MHMFINYSIYNININLIHIDKYMVECISLSKAIACLHRVYLLYQYNSNTPATYWWDCILYSLNYISTIHGHLGIIIWFYHFDFRQFPLYLLLGEVELLRRWWKNWIIWGAGGACLRYQCSCFPNQRAGRTRILLSVVVGLWSGWSILVEGYSLVRSLRLVGQRRWDSTSTAAETAVRPLPAMFCSISHLKSRDIRSSINDYRSLVMLRFHIEGFFQNRWSQRITI